MSNVKRLRDWLPEWVPWWLSDRKYSSGKTVGYRFVWTMVAMLDYYIEWALQAVIARFPGVGTSTALNYIGRSRGIIRNQSGDDASFILKLIGWLDRWSNAGSATRLAIELHEYLANNPRVRVVNRAGFMVTISTTGVITTNQVAWDWDSVSNPERSGYWSEMWVIIYPTQWSIVGNWGTGTWNDVPLGLGHDVDRQSYDAVKGLLSQWKAAHSRVRAVIWTSDNTLFDPLTPASLPDGTWGMWSNGAGAPGGRNLTTCRYWEP